MNRKKIMFAEEIELYDENSFSIRKINKNEYLYEIGNISTTDVAEAVSVMMRIFPENDRVWNNKIHIENLSDLTPEKTLYWLTGGDDEWISLKHYNRPWSDCYLIFQKEFAFDILKSTNDSKTLGDIRNKFIKYLNLPTLYDFALRENLIR